MELDRSRLPTLLRVGNGVEGDRQHLREDLFDLRRDGPDLTHVVDHSLNEWLHETWTFNYENRIFTTPVVTLAIVERAIEELEWAVERGARCVLIRPAPVPAVRLSARS